MIQGLVEGVIDGICANHTPEDVENKKLEFNYARFGAATFDAMAHVLLSGKSQEEMAAIVGALTYGNRKIYHLDMPKMEVGAKANLTVFEKGNFELNQPKSKAYNVILKGESLQFRIADVLLNK